MTPACSAPACWQDHVREKPENAALKSLTLKEFTGLIFEKVWPQGVSLGCVAGPLAGHCPRRVPLAARVPPQRLQRCMHGRVLPLLLAGAIV